MAVLKRNYLIAKGQELVCNRSYTSNPICTQTACRGNYLEDKQAVMQVSIHTKMPYKSQKTGLVGSSSSASGLLWAGLHVNLGRSADYSDWISAWFSSVVQG
jgi:hypothetical protein